MRKGREILTSASLVCICLFLNACLADRVVMRADVVRDYPEQCYDVPNCRPRRVNESWALGPCALASCERHEVDRDMLLEIHYSCPRLQTRGLTTNCEMIEDLRLVFPWCCPRIICSHPLTTFSTSTSTTTIRPRQLRKRIRYRHRVASPQNQTLHLAEEAEIHVPKEEAEEEAKEQNNDILEKKN